jgi:hypothetical protein
MSVSGSSRKTAGDYDAAIRSVASMEESSQSVLGELENMALQGEGESCML